MSLDIGWLSCSQQIGQAACMWTEFAQRSAEYGPYGVTPSNSSHLLKNISDAEIFIIDYFLRGEERALCSTKQVCPWLGYDLHSPWFLTPPETSLWARGF